MPQPSNERERLAHQREKIQSIARTYGTTPEHIAGIIERFPAFKSYAHERKIQRMGSTYGASRDTIVETVLRHPRLVSYDPDRVRHDIASTLGNALGLRRREVGELVLKEPSLASLSPQRLNGFVDILKSPSLAKAAKARGRPLDQKMLREWIMTNPHYLRASPYVEMEEGTGRAVKLSYRGALDRLRFERERWASEVKAGVPRERRTPRSTVTRKPAFQKIARRWLKIRPK